MADNISGDEQLQQELCFHLLSKGRKQFVLSDLEGAAETLAQAVQLSVKLYGQFAPETYEHHLFYGRAMLEIARQEDELFSMKKFTSTSQESESSDEDSGHVIIADESEAKDEMTNQCENLNIEKKETEGEEMETAAVGSGTNDEDDKKDDQEGNKDEKAKAESEGQDDTQVLKIVGEIDKEVGNDGEKSGDADAVNGETEKEEDDYGDDTEDDDSINPIQIAWECLEVARRICNEHLQEEGWKERKVETLISLAECAFYDEGYIQALEDLDECLSMMNDKSLDPNDRRFAQAFYLKGRAHSFNKQFDQAAEALANSKTILGVTLERLEKEREENEKAAGDRVAELTVEINDLKSVLMDLQGIVDDAAESHESLLEVDKPVKKVRNELGEGRGILEPAKDVSDLVHRRDKRSVNDSQSDESVSKKSRRE